MFSVLTPSARVFFPTILIVWLLAYIIGMVIGKKDANERRRFNPFGKVAMMLCAITVSLIIWLDFTRGTEIESYARLITFGLIAGIVGDSILAKLLPFKHTLLPGMLAFAIGHLFYFFAIISAVRLLGISDFALFPLVLFVPSLLIVFGWYRVVRPVELGEKGKRGMLVYVLLLVAITMLAVYSAFMDPRLNAFAIGLTLFLLSDLLLIGDLTAFFRFRSIGDVVWIIYAAGQMLIAFSALNLL